MRLLFSLVLLTSLVTALAQDAPKAATPAFKNLKVLQPSDIRPMMGAFRTGLGVQCNFCHVQGDFSSDENPHKEIARKMIVMVREVNAKFPDGKEHVTCYTCHRGAQEPLMTAPAAAPPAQ
jgi:photosynthetic reaction center cytochrome c subunit